MLSAFGHKLSSVESTIEEHAKILTEIQILLESNEEAKLNTAVDERQGALGIRRLLDGIGTRLNKIEGRLDELTEGVKQNSSTVLELKSRMMWMYHPSTPMSTASLCSPSAMDNTSSRAQMDGMAREEKMRGYPPLHKAKSQVHNTSSCFDRSPRTASVVMNLGLPSHHTGQSYADSVRNRSLPASIDTTPHGDGSISAVPPRAHHLSRSVGSCGSSETDKESGSLFGIPCEPPARHSEDVLHCLEKVKQFQTEIHKRDQIIKELISSQEQLTRKEKELTQKEEWYEHKMRLLKQDKRRRGETIGKLLRCIDDVKDQGRLDEVKLVDGRQVLAATIGSRGLTIEDRITAAVEAMEAERAATQRIILLSESETVTEKVDDIDGDTQPLCSPPPIGFSPHQQNIPEHDNDDSLDPASVDRPNISSSD